MSGSWNSGWVTGDIITASEYRKGLGCIFDSTLGADAASFDITGIAAPFGAAHLKLVLKARTSEAVNLSSVRARFNNDSSANYFYQRVDVAAAVVTGTATASDTSGILGFCLGNNAGATEFSQIEATFADYAATARRMSWQSSSAEYSGLTISGGELAVAAAISRLTIFPGGGNFKLGSRCSLYVMGV